ncbi:MAG: hypothetical protein PHO37_16990 [Kiritimatiellae bacterium]|nr:hypothetical protein [Kiritimatiellia bacterium]
MTTWFSDFNGLELFYLICAVTGALFVAFKMVLLIISGDIDTDIDVDLDAGGDLAGEHSDSDAGFHWLSMLGLSSFFMMFGLVGLTCYRQYHLGTLISMFGSTAGGVMSVWIIGKIFQGASKLQSSGTLRTADAVGCSGTVYLNIPENGTGRVTLNFNNHLRELDAVAHDGSALPTGTLVRVVEVKARVLSVEAIK